MLVRGRSYARRARFSAIVGSGSLARRARSGRQERAAAAFLCQVAVGALPTLQAAAEPCLSVANPTRRKPALCCRRLRMLARRVRSGRQERAAAASLCQVPVGALPTPQAAADPCLAVTGWAPSVPASLLRSGPGPLPGELAQEGRSGQRLPPCVKSR